jgi:myo-inositol catabolism protein IolC
MLKQFNELFFLPFDHRTSFEKDLFEIIDRTPTLEETEEILKYKNIIYDGFKEAIKKGVPKNKAGILVDEQFGIQILNDAKALGFWTACSTEKSGVAEFDFEYGLNFKEHIFRIRPDFVKVLVRFNPEGDKDLNKRQSERLKKLSDFCIDNHFRLMFELLVPATDKQTSQVGDDLSKYDLELRPKLMIGAIRALQEKGIEPAIWKVEGVSCSDDCFNIVKQAQINSRNHVGVIVLGRGENLATIKKWLTIASRIHGFIGFAVGRTVWEDVLKLHKNNQISSAEASELIALNFKSFCDLWMDNKRSYEKHL